MFVKYVPGMQEVVNNQWLLFCLSSEPHPPAAERASMTANFLLITCLVLEKVRLLIHLQRTPVWRQNGSVLWQRLSQS